MALKTCGRRNGQLALPISDQKRASRSGRRFMLITHTCWNHCAGDCDDSTRSADANNPSAIDWEWFIIARLHIEKAILSTPPRDTPIVFDCWSNHIQLYVTTQQEFLVPIIVWLFIYMTVAALARRRR